EKLHHEMRVGGAAIDPDDADDVGMGDLPADFRFVEQKSAVDRIPRPLRQQQLHGKMPHAVNFDDLPNLASLARHNVSEQLISAEYLFCHVRLLTRGQKSEQTNGQLCSYAELLTSDL